ISAEVDQGAQGAWPTGGYVGDRVAVADAIGGLILVDDGGYLSALAFGENRAIVIDQHIQLYGRRHIAIEVEHPHREAFADLIGSTGGIGVAVVEGVIGEGIGPGTTSTDRERAVLALHHAAVGHVDPVTVYVLHLQRRQAIRRI